MADVTIDQFNARLAKAITEVGQKLPVLVDEKALNSLALMKDRFIQRGENVDASGNETSFPSYSPGYKKRKDEVYGGTPNRLVGLGSKKNNVSGGDMLRKLKIVNRVSSGGIYSVQIGASDAFSEEKLEKNIERYGDFLNLSNKEVQIIQETLTDDLIELLNNALE